VEAIACETLAEEIGKNWSELRLTDAALINRLIEFATVLPDHIADTARQLHSEDLHHNLIDRMADSSLAELKIA